MRRSPSAAGAGSTVILALLALIVLALCLWTARVRTTSGEHRWPPTAGAPLAAATPAGSQFRDVTAESGIDFVHDNGASGSYYIREIMSGGG